MTVSRPRRHAVSVPLADGELGAAQEAAVRSLARPGEPLAVALRRVLLAAAGRVDLAISPRALAAWGERPAYALRDLLDEARRVRTRPDALERWVRSCPRHHAHAPGRTVTISVATWGGVRTIVDVRLSHRRTRTRRAAEAAREVAP